MVEQILNGLFFGFLIYMLMGVMFALLRSPRFYELVVGCYPSGDVSLQKRFPGLIDSLCVLRTLCCPCGYSLSTRAQAGPQDALI
jgi:hypothetical protein